MSTRVEPETAVPPTNVTVDAEEIVYRYTPANNGAGPLWCMGGTTLVRTGDRVFTTGLETIPGARPLNNCRWNLWNRSHAGWSCVYSDLKERTREPNPLACLEDNRLFVSANPSRTAPDEYAGPSEPQVIEFDARQPSTPHAIHRPAWSEAAPFGEHSYRSFAADAKRGELWLMHNLGYDRSYWSFRDGAGQWSACGRLFWPRDANYPEPQPVRLCYPCVALRDRAVHILGVSDIEEPNPAFRAFKFELTGQKWDYDFRRLFYAWTPNLAHAPFGEWIEIASRDSTCGWISPLDVHVESERRVHLLWHERSCDVRLRARFFPDTALTNTLEYAIAHEGRIVHRCTLARHEEHDRTEQPAYARFHDAGDGRLFVVGVFRASGDADAGVLNRVAQIENGAVAGTWATVDLRAPFAHPFFTASPRAGTRPSDTIDLLGMAAGSPSMIRYAQLRISPLRPPRTRETH